MKVKCGKCWGGRRRTHPGDDTRCLERTRNGDAQASPAARIKPTTAPACALPRSRARPSPRGRARRISGHVVPGLTARVATTLVVLSLRSRSRVACVGPRGPSPSPTAGVARGAVRAPRAARGAAGVGVGVQAPGEDREVRCGVCGARAASWGGVMGGVCWVVLMCSCWSLLSAYCESGF